MLSDNIGKEPEYVYENVYKIFKKSILTMPDYGGNINKLSPERTNQPIPKGKLRKRKTFLKII